MHTNSTTFTTKLRTLEAAIGNSNRLIDDQLNVVSKWSVKWIFLTLLSPFYALFGKDAFSHVRVQIVANKLFQLMQENRAYIESDQNLRKEILVEVWNQLDKRTHQKYSDLLQNFVEQVSHFVPAGEQQEREKAICLQWPDDAETLNITDAEKRELVAKITKLFDLIFRLGYEITSQDGKRDKTWTVELSLKYSAPTPFSFPVHLCFTNPKDPLAGLFLLSDVIVGKGGQRTVKLCYDLLQGRSYVRKKNQSPNELRVANQYGKTITRGIAPVRAIRLYGHQTEKQQIIEDYFEGTIASVYGKGLSAHEMQKLMKDLLMGLAALHENEDFHGDISAENALVRRGADSLWEAALTDFGCASNNPLIAGKFGWFCPQKAKFFNNRNNPDPSIRDNPNPFIRNNPYIFFKVNHYKSDLWSLGLVFAGLLLGRTYQIASFRMISRIVREPNQEGLFATLFSSHFPEPCLPRSSYQAALVRLGNTDIPYLTFLRHTFFLDKSDNPRQYFGWISQEDINDELEELCLGSAEETKPLWEVVKKMLQLDESSRPSAQQLSLLL